MRLFEHPTPMDQAEALAISISHALELAIRVNGWAVLAVSGGRSPVPNRVAAAVALVAG